MLKALLMASVIIGAFLFQPVKANENLDRCPLGGTYNVIDGLHMCTTPAPLSDLRLCTSSSGELYGNVKPGEWMECAARIQPTVPSSQPTNSCNFSPLFNQTSADFGSAGWKWGLKQLDGSCSEPIYGRSKPVGIATPTQDYYCPPDDKPQFTNFYPVEPEGGNCWYPANDLSNDDDCPPGTVGDCNQPPEEPECSIAGNGMEVCPADPNEKCTSWVQDGQTYYDCPTNCGFINDQFFCTSNPDIPDIPDMSDCFKVATGYACPSDTPDPDDNIDNPNKPLPDMTKGDFKETNKGIETRLNATNKLLGDLTGIGAANNQALSDLNAKQLAANGFLRNIAQNTADTAKNTGDIKDALTGDEFTLEEDTAQSILDGLGLTGDEKFSDLEKEVISLDSYRSQFTWSAGSSSCPPDRSMSLLGKSFLIDWQPYCDAFGVLGYFIEAAALLLSGFIAFGVRK
jgi:hypothetical protein